VLLIQQAAAFDRGRHRVVGRERACAARALDRLVAAILRGETLRGHAQHHGFVRRARRAGERDHRAQRGVRLSAALGHERARVRAASEQPEGEEQGRARSGSARMPLRCGLGQRHGRLASVHEGVKFFEVVAQVERSSCDRSSEPSEIAG
jgi:hypothetical protein